MTDTPPEPLDDSDRRLLLQNEVRPAVEAGTYTVTVTTAVTGQGVTKDYSEKASHGLTVAGPRFSLDAGAVASVYPPPGSTSDYRQTMAHLALAEPTLPWQRDADGVGAPWLALAVFSDDDLKADTQTGKTWSERAVTDFLGQCKKPPADLLLPDLGDEQLPQGVTTCRTIDITAEVFTDVLPRLAEIAQLAFVRRVREDPDRTWADGSKGPGKDAEHATAVLLSARLPHTPGDYSAHLVSLEGLGKHLDGTQGGFKTARLLSLYSWSFHHDPDARGSFKDAVDHLVTSTGTDLLLRLPVPGGCDKNTKDSVTAAAARRRVCAGYVPLTHRLPTGERTLAWYRGPFAPVAPSPTPRRPETLTSETDALVYDSDHGVFDVSHASAFALGRFLLLADPALNQALAVLRKDVHATVHTAIAQGAMCQGPDAPPARAILERARTAPPAPPGQSPRVARHLHATGSARHRLEALLAAAPAGAPPPEQDPSEGDVPDALDVLETGPDAPQDSAMAQLIRHVVDLHTETVDDAVRARKLLAALPLDHLVPDRRLLPPESVRFFTVDGQWLAVMLAGALRMGQATSLDQHVTRLLQQRLLDEAALPACGMLVRSRVVRDWPSLITEAPGDKAATVLYSPPQRLAPDLLLAYFTTTPGQVVLRRPAEQPHYGLDGEDSIILRNLADPQHLGQTLHENCTGIRNLLRTGCVSNKPTETLAILTPGDKPDCLNRALRKALADHGRWPTDKGNKDRLELTSAELGLQLLDTTARLVFERPGYQPHPQAPEATP
ncbi:hypothetical protein ABT097_10195 [Streptomyces sp. NPDC002225]|uniref:hypothetical protein n=1 Tax=Streptomyces sp. NPDC002225 TaxID=3154413 RepID=UPI00332DFD05